MLLFVATDVCKIDSRIMEEEGRSHLEDNSNWSYTESPDDAWPGQHHRWWIVHIIRHFYPSEVLYRARPFVGLMITQRPVGMYTLTLLLVVLPAGWCLNFIFFPHFCIFDEVFISIKTCEKQHCLLHFYFTLEYETRAWRLGTTR